MADVNVGTIGSKVVLEDGFSSVLEGINEGVEKFKEGFMEAAGVVAGGAASFLTIEGAVEGMKEGVHAAAEELQELVVEGAKSADIQASFEHLTGAAGELGDELIGKLQTATHGTVDELTLMKTVNQDLAAGMKLTDAQMGTLASGALALSKATGQDVTSAMDSMNSAMLTGRTRAIALLTGKIDLKSAEEAFAASIGGTTKELTAEGKMEADREAILNAVSAATARVGDSQDGLSQMLQRAAASWANFQDDLGKSIATSPELVAGFKAIASELSAAFGADKAGLIKTITGYVNSAAEEVLVLAKSFAQASGVFVDGYEDVKILFDYMMMGLLKIDEYAIEAGLALAKMTGAPKDQMASLNAELGLVKTQIDAFDHSIDTNAGTANKWNDTITQLDGSIAKVQGAMTAASAKATEHDAIMQRVMASYTGSKASLDALTAATATATAAEGKHDQYLKASEDDTKKLAQAHKDLASIGTSYADTVSKINAETVTQVENYLKLGASSSDLEQVYKLTADQIKAISESMKEADTTQKQLQKDTEDASKRWADYYDQVAQLSGSTTQKQAADIQKWVADEIASHAQAKTDTADFYTWLAAESDVKMQAVDQAMLRSNVNSKEHFQELAQEAEDAYNFAQAHADSFTADYISQLRETSVAAQDAAQNWQASIGSTLDGLTSKAEALNSAISTVLDESGNVLNGGYSSPAITQLTIDQTPGGADELLKELRALQTQVSRTPTNIDDAIRLFQQKAELSSLESAYDMLIAQAKNPKADLGLGIPSFAQGGSGDFGTGTLAMLHGKETIVPDGKTLGGGPDIKIYVNGTAADVARQVSTQIQKRLSQRRQFPAS